MAGLPLAVRFDKNPDSELDYYHDDFEEVEQKKSIFRFLAIALASVLAVTGLTLASNININTNGQIEYGQAVTKALACDSAVLMDLNENFVNQSGGGYHVLSTIQVSNIDSSVNKCAGDDFIITLYDSTTSTPLYILDSITSITVADDGSTFTIPSTPGLSISSADNTTFTLTINGANNPARTRNIAKITFESRTHLAAPVANYSLGDVGPGGGNIFYKDLNGFSCGASFTATGSPTGDLCHYLEAAPKTWSDGSADVRKLWAKASVTTTNISGIVDDASAYNNSAAIGLGYKNSTLIVAQGNDSTTAAGAARAYAGGGKSDWYLPTTAELNVLFQWSRGLTTNVSALVTGGTTNSNFQQAEYWSSSETANDQARCQYFNVGNQDSRAKSDTYYVRPVRAF